MMRLAVAGLVSRPTRARPATRTTGRALAHCPRCGHTRSWLHRGCSCVAELQVIYDPDGVRCGCTDQFHA
jgi:hypothetical protein